MLAEGGEENSAVSSLSSCSSLFAPSPRYPILHGKGFCSSRQLKQKTNGCAPVSRNWREPHFSRREWNKAERVNSPPPDCVCLRGASFFVFFPVCFPAGHNPRWAASRALFAYDWRVSPFPTFSSSLWSAMRLPLSFYFWSMEPERSQLSDSLPFFSSRSRRKKQFVTSPRWGGHA